MKTLKLYAIQRNLDTTEGRGPMKTVYYTSDKSLANKILNNPLFYKQYGIMGSLSGVSDSDIKLENITVLETMEDFFLIEKSEKAKIALAKLSDADKEILGLK